MKYANEARILTTPQQRFNVFKAKNPITRVPLGFSPKHGQEFAPTCEISCESGMRIMDLIESIPARFAHESGHHYHYCRCKSLPKKRAKAAQEKIAAFDWLTLVSEIPAWLFEFRYRITHENDLKTGDAYDVIGKVACMLDLEYGRSSARCSNFALSIASLENKRFNILVDRTINQLTPMWSGADIVKPFKNCKIVDNAKPAEYGITFDGQQNSFVMKYNAAENLIIMKRWLNKIGYDDADVAIEKIKGFYRESVSELVSTK